MPSGIGAVWLPDSAGGCTSRIHSGKRSCHAQQYPSRFGRKIVFGFLEHRSWRRVTTWLLAVMQLHLLVVLVLHHHVLPRISVELTPTATSVGQTSRQSQPAGAEEGYCSACQILRHGAVRPSLGSMVPHHSLVVPLLAPLSAVVVLSTQSAAWHGRAPPLA